MPAEDLKARIQVARCEAHAAAAQALEQFSEPALVASSQGLTKIDLEVLLSEGATPSMWLVVGSPSPAFLKAAKSVALIKRGPLNESTLTGEYPLIDKLIPSSHSALTNRVALEAVYKAARDVMAKHFPGERWFLLQKMVPVRPRHKVEARLSSKDRFRLPLRLNPKASFSTVRLCR